MAGQLNAGMRKSSVKTLVMSFVGHGLFVLLVLGVLLVPLLLLTGCDQVKKENPYTGRTASLDVAREDHEREGEKLADDQEKADKAAQDARRKALEEAELARQERQRKFEVEAARLQREFAVERARTQASHETSLDELAVSRDVDVSKIYAAAKVRADEDVARIVEPITQRTQAFNANALFLRDWERENEERRAQWTLGLDVAKGIASAVPGGGLAELAITGLGTLLLGGAGATVVTQRRGRKQADASWDDGYKTAKAEEAAKRQAEHEAWDESAKKSQPDPTIALVSSLTTAILAATSKSAGGFSVPASPAAPVGPSPASPASKDAA